MATIVQPAAIAGATFHDSSSSGKFHGVIIATTPTGSLRIRPSAFGVCCEIASPRRSSVERGVVVEHVGGEQDLVARQRDRLAELETDPASDHVGALAKQLGGAPEDGRPTGAAAVGHGVSSNARRAAATASVDVRGRSPRA